MFFLNSGNDYSVVNYKWCSNFGNFVFELDEKQAFFFKNILAKHDIKRVLDVFCGSGELAVLLAKWGLEVTVFAPEPLAVKEINSKRVRAGVQLEICLGDMRDISNLYRERCDLIVCLQNSLSCLLTEEDIWGTLAQIYLKLKPGGVLIIHTLNYDCLLQGKDYLIPILEKHCLGLKSKLFLKRGGNGEHAKLILKIIPAGIRAGIRTQQEEIKIPVRPIFKKELDLWLTEMGFEDIICYDWFSEKLATSNSYHRVTVAYRPRAATFVT